MIDEAQRADLTFKALMDSIPDGTILIGNTDAGDYTTINSEANTYFGTKYGTIEIVKQSSIRCLFLWHANSKNYPPCIGYYYNNHSGDEQLEIQKIGTNNAPPKVKRDILWTGNASTVGTTLTLKQSLANYEIIGIQYNSYGANDIAWFRPNAHTTYKINKTNLNDASGDLAVDLIECTINKINNTSLRLGKDSSNNATPWKITTKNNGGTWSTAVCSTVSINEVFGI